MINKWTIFNQCTLCQSACPQGTLLCAQCRLDLPRSGNACHGCARPLPHDETGLCGKCITTGPVLDNCLAAFDYHRPVDFLIHQFKFQGQYGLSQWFARQLVARLISLDAPLPRRLVPVPLHPARVRQRGYNQSLLLALEVGKLLNIDVDFATCRRIRDTQSQSDLPADERRANIRNAFVLSGTPELDHIAIIDDVMTTGSTLAEMARLFQRKNACRVDAWVIARTVM